MAYQAFMIAEQSSMSGRVIRVRDDAECSCTTQNTDRQANAHPVQKAVMQMAGTLLVQKPLKSDAAATATAQKVVCA